MEEAVRSNTPAGLPTARCWVWQGNISSTGYGRATFGTQIISAHRAAWEVANGREVPSGMIVRHRCDNRPCVNPDHLEIGTQADNTRDMLWGRSPHPFNSKLTESDVVEIRARRDTGETYRSIAEDYPVTMFAIMSACTGRTWKHVP